MSMVEMILAQAELLAGSLSAREMELLEVFSQVALKSLTGRLKEEVTPESCQDDLVSAAALLALAALSEADTEQAVEQFSAGEITMRMTSGGKSAAADCLRTQARMLMQPYLKVPARLLGV